MSETKALELISAFNGKKPAIEHVDRLIKELKNIEFDYDLKDHSPETCLSKTVIPYYERILLELHQFIETEFKGSSETKVGNIALGCITPEARELLDKIMEQWEKETPPEQKTENHYPFAYWLVRYSGLIKPNI